MITFHCTCIVELIRTSQFHLFGKVYKRVRNDFITPEKVLWDVVIVRVTVHGGGLIAVNDFRAENLCAFTFMCSFFPVPSFGNDFTSIFLILYKAGKRVPELSSNNFENVLVFGLCEGALPARDTTHKL